MPLTKDETQWYMTRLYRFLRQGHEFTFGKSQTHRGWIEDYREDGDPICYVFLEHRDRMFSTLIHEFLHYQHPEWSETQVRVMERKLVNSLSERQVKNLIKRFAEAI